MKNDYVRITTFHRAHNYGAVLQTFALQEAIRKKFNKKVEILDYRNSNIEEMYKPLNIYCKGLKRKIKGIMKYVVYHRKLNKRYREFKKFISKNFFLTKSYYTKNEIENDIHNSDICYITGSDQVWNIDIARELSDIYTLNFDTKGGKKISYAASVGDVSLVDKYKDEYTNKIEKISNVSVREEDAKEALSKYIKKNIDVVLDPTLLLTSDEWNEKIVEEKIVNEDEKYIVAYMVADDDDYIEIVNELSKRTGLKIIHFGLKNPGHIDILKSAYGEGPIQFVNYIKNAEYVVTTSFHASVFSIIFHKKFFVVPHKRTGSRVLSLLNKLGIKGRAINTLEQFKEVDYNMETDWKSVDDKLEEERKKSVEWLKKAIEG